MEGTGGFGGTERLARRLDAGSCLFLFGYYLRALEDAAGGWRLSGEGDSQAQRFLARLHDTASRSEVLEPFVDELADVMKLLAERTKDGGPLGEGLPLLLDRCARRWFQRVRELPKRRNSLAVDIAFNSELAGLGEVAAGLYEAILCLEAGAFRASRAMSKSALASALDEAGVPAGGLGCRLERARRAGLVGPADVRPAAASFGGPEEGTGPEDADGESAEWALEAALRLAKKLLRPNREEALLRASEVESSRAGPAR